MRANGKMTKPAAEEDSLMRMATFTKENSPMICQMVMGSTYMLVVPDIRVTGRVISMTAMENTLYKMAQSTRDISKKDSNMERAYSNTTTVPCTMAILKTTN